MTATYGYDATAYSAGIIYGNAIQLLILLAYDVTSNLTVPNVGVITTDAFISKYSADGTTMLWTTFIGGGTMTFMELKQLNSLICDKFNNVYLYGVTSSDDFPIQGGYQSRLVVEQLYRSISMEPISTMMEQIFSLQNLVPMDRIYWDQPTWVDLIMME